VNGRSASRSGRELALYFFHLCDGRDTLIDPDGREVSDAATLCDIAIKEARAMISQDALGGKITLNQFIEVRDEAGKLIHQTAFRDAVSVG
jgi:hypothetical protein